MTIINRQPSQQANRAHEALNANLPYFCDALLKIKLKEGGLGPFKLNRAQQYLHERIEDQKKRTGMVRILVLKGRQQGVSTYVAARFYHKNTRNRNHRAFILSHQSVTTETLFQIVANYHENCPETLKPKLITSNNRRMVFSNGSQYTVGTAGSGAIGRGDTNQYFHGSEVAFFENVGDIATGVLQTVPDLPGTEIILESTANGIGNFFHQACMDALDNKGRYEIVFIPWYWQSEYQAQTSPNLELTDDELTMQRLYNLTSEQLQWRRNKIASPGFSENLFHQEYPFTPEEAFISTGASLISLDAIAKARKSNLKDPNAPIILGVDPGPVNDRTVLAWRQGHHLTKVEVFPGTPPMTLAGQIAKRIDRYNIAKVFIDTAEGRGIVDRLHELGYRQQVVGIPFSMSPSDPDRYVNKRAEMAGELKDWLEDENGSRIPDDDNVAMELGVIPDWKTTSNGKLQLVSKDDIKKIYGKSTDIFDAIMLTFAQPVRRDYNVTSHIKKKYSRNRQSELCATRNRHRKPQQDEEFDWDESSGKFKSKRDRGLKR